MSTKIHIKRINIKRFFILTVLTVFSATSIVSLAQPQKAKATSDESRNRRYVAGLIQCLDFAKENDDSISSFDELISGGLDSEYAVVGLDMDSVNGVIDCNTAFQKSAQILGWVTSDNLTDAREWIERYVSGDNLPFAEHDNGKIKASQTKDGVYKLIKEVLAPYVNSVPVTDEELAERLIHAATFCYGYSTNSSAFSNPEFQNNSEDGQIIYATKQDISANNAAAFVNLDKRNGFEAFGIGSGDDHSYLGNLQLSFNLRTGLNSSFSGGWDGPYTSNFLPLGADTINYDNLITRFTTRDDGTVRGTVQDCNIVKELAPRIFPHYTLSSDRELLFNGKTSSDLISEAPEDPDANFSEGDSNPSCEGADALGWIICPLLASILNLNDVIFRKFILPFLIVDPINTNEGLVYSVWSAFRTVGNILLVFALLFIVFGQAIGGGLVDAYTAKKAMPRIFIAAILINISIYIVAFMVDMGNILGAGIGEMITAPAEASGNFAYKVDGIAALLTIVAIIGGIVLAFIVGAMVKEQYKKAAAKDRSESTKFILMATLFFGFPILLIIVGIFATLIIRLGIILFLTVISPVALAMFAIPSAEKYAKKWLDFLIKSILVYPIVVALFAISYLLSVMVSSTSGGVDFSQLIVALISYGGIIAAGGVIGSTVGDTSRAGTGVALGSGVTIALLLSGTGPDLGISGSDIITSFISVIILFIPLVLIPFSFKVAGGIMGSLLGAVTKARERTDTIVRGDKHNPHGRFNNTGKKLGEAFGDNRKKYLKDVRHGAHNSDAEKLSDLMGDGISGRFAKGLSAKRELRRSRRAGESPVVNVPRNSDASPTSGAGNDPNQKARTAAEQRDRPTIFPSVDEHNAFFDDPEEDNGGGAGDGGGGAGGGGGGGAGGGGGGGAGGGGNIKPPYMPGGPGAGLYKGPLTAEDIAPIPGHESYAEKARKIAEGAERERAARQQAATPDDQE